MKVTLGITIVLACCIVAGVAVHHRWVRPRLAPPHGAMTFREGGGPGPAIPASSTEVTSIVSWIDSHQTGWHLSFATYAPQATFSSNTFHINVGDNFVVLNYARDEGDSFVELVRNLPEEEQLFWRGVISRIKQPNPAQPAEDHAVAQNIRDRDSIPPLDAHGFKGVQEIGKSELVQLMSKSRPLSDDEKSNLDRGCLGLTSVYQGLGLRRWPELAPGTVAYLTRENALDRRCPNSQKNFIFLKQGWWLGGHAPRPDRATGEVSVESVTRMKPGFYTFNYAVYFPATETYAWMNHRDYGVPANWIRPQKAYLSALPPPLDDGRPAQIYCSTCR